MVQFFSHWGTCLCAMSRKDNPCSFWSPRKKCLKRTWGWLWEEKKRNAFWSLYLLRWKKSSFCVSTTFQIMLHEFALKLSSRCDVWRGRHMSRTKVKWIFLWFFKRVLRIVEPKKKRREGILILLRSSCSFDVPLCVYDLERRESCVSLSNDVHIKLIVFSESVNLYSIYFHLE